MAKYGIPWMGSKSSFVDKIIDLLPPADNFYDLFGGGFSVSHAALLSGKYKNIHFNEPQPGICKLINDAINGKYSYENFKPEFIGKEMFNCRKAEDAYVATVWSFGNNGKHYLFSAENEKRKKSLHNAVVFGDFDSYARNILGFSTWNTSDIKKRRLICRSISCGKDKNERGLERLQQLERLERLQLTTVDYRDVNIKDNSIIYCDPPYSGTRSYVFNSFDHNDFFEWVGKHRAPIFFSEYEAPVKFKCVFEYKRIQRLGATKKRKIFTEKIFANASTVKLLKENGVNYGSPGSS